MSEESTTPDLVERSRRAFQVLSSGDVETAMSVYAPDAVYESVGLGTSFEGLTAIRGFLRDWFAPYDEWKIEPEEILDLGNGVIFGVVRAGGRPVGSIGRVEWRYAVLLVWVQGLIMRMTTSRDIDEARAAAERLAKERG
jgi:ketosteroid isomerase-like protein